MESAISMCSMLKPGGLVACPSRKILKNRCPEIESEVNLESIYLTIQRVIT